MILLLGGTSSTSPIAQQLAERGHHVLVSRATDVPLDVGDHPNIQCRCGLLDEHSLAELIDRRGIRAIVDATHPYAVLIRATARHVAEVKGIPYLSFVRPAVVEAGTPGVEFAPDHPSAAALAFSHGRPVLLTVGVRNLAPYVAEASRTALPMMVRVLDRAESREQCRRAGVREEDILSGRGPYTVAENRRHLRQFGIGALVTKDSGRSGGTLEKLEAAHAEGCRVVVVARPEIGGGATFGDIDSLVESLARLPME
jgi:precorrin-6A/cobalt-precorrin-6A reductase